MKFFAVAGLLMLTSAAVQAASLTFDNASDAALVKIRASQFESGFSVNGNQIQSPGFGNKRTNRSLNPSSVIGNAKPIASAVNISRVSNAGLTIATPNAVAIKGAVQGDATMTANTPVKN